MDLLAKVSSPAIGQKYLDQIKGQIVKTLFDRKGYNAQSQPKCSQLEEVLSSTVSPSVHLSQSCCALVELLVQEGYLDRKFAVNQLQSSLSCALDSPSASTFHTSAAMTLLPKLAYMCSFTNPLIVLLNEYPQAWPMVLSIVESIFYRVCDERSDRKVIDFTLSPEDMKYLILHSLLRPEWPLEHSRFRGRLIGLLLKDDKSRPILGTVSTWMPMVNTQIMDCCQIVTDCATHQGGLENLVAVLALFSEVHKKDLDFTSLLRACSLMADGIEDGRGHPSLALLIGSLFVSCGRMYCETLVVLTEKLLKKSLIPNIEYLKVPVHHSACDPASGRWLIDCMDDIQERIESKPLPLHRLPVDLVAACNVASNEDFAPGRLPCGIPNQLQIILAAGKLLGCSGEHVMGWIEEITRLARSNTDNSCMAFYAIRIRLRSESNPDLVFSLMNALPDVATNKMSATFVRDMLLQTVSRPALYGVALKLLTNLYLKYDNLCFPYLLGSINASGDPNSSWTSTMAKAMAIKTVIEHSPALHGIDVVAPLTALLQSTIPESESIILICFDAIRHLIEQEIMDFQSFMKKFAHFDKDPRPSVRAGFLRLMDLAAEVKLTDAQRQSHERQLFLTFFNESEPPTVRSACLRALSSFSGISVTSLPGAELEKLKGIEELSSIPSSYYMELYRRFAADSVIRKAFSEFFASRLRQEVADLPRSVITNKELVSRRDVQDSTLAQIPRLQQSFLHSATDIRGHVAVGLLLTYNPPVKTDADGLPLKTSVIQHARSFRTMLKSLLETVPVFDQDNWFMSICAMPQWHLLVSRGFKSLMDGRRAERETNDSMQASSSMWARDEMCTIFSEIDSPNSVIAFCSLIAVISEYDKGLDFKERVQIDQNRSYLPHSTWHKRALESILQFAKKQKVTDSYFAELLSNFKRSPQMADLAASSVLFSSHQFLHLIQSRELLEDFLLMFLQDSTPQREFFITVGAGLAIQRLVVRGLVDLSDNMRQLCTKLIKHFDATAFDDDKVVRPCYLIGLTLMMSGLCSLKSFSSLTQTFCARLIRLLRETSPHREPFETIATCASILVANACNYVLSKQSLEDLAAWLTQTRTDHKYSAGLSLALGITSCAMAIQQDIGNSSDDKGHKLVEALVTKVFLPVVASTNEAVQNKIAAVRGIAALTGALNHLLVQYRDLSWDCNTILSRDVTASLLESMIRDLNATSQTSELKGHHIWTLGLFHQCLTKDVKKGVVYPSTIQLRNTILSDILANAKDLNQSDIASALGQEFETALPCFAWTTFDHLLKSSAHLDILKLAVLNCGKTQSLVPLVETALSENHIQRYSVCAKDFLMDNVGRILEVCDVSKVGNLLRIFREERLNSNDERVAEDAWKSLLNLFERYPSKASLISILVELISQALPLTVARYNAAACLFQINDPMFRDIILRNLSGKGVLRYALQLRLTVSGALDTSVIGNPFAYVEELGPSEFNWFIRECLAVNCNSPAADNSAKWVLEILPNSVNERSLCLLSLISIMVSSDGIVTQYTDSELLQVLPYQIHQLIHSKVWGQTAIVKLIEWLISKLAVCKPSSPTYTPLYDALLALKNIQAFKSGDIWPRAVLLPHPS